MSNVTGPHDDRTDPTDDARRGDAAVHDHGGRGPPGAAATPARNGGGPEPGTRWRRYLTIGCGAYLVATVGTFVTVGLGALFGSVGVDLLSLGTADPRMPGPPGAGVSLVMILTYMAVFGMTGVLATALGTAIGYTSEPAERGVSAAAAANAVGMIAVLALPTLYFATTGDPAVPVALSTGFVVGAVATGAAGGFVGELADSL